jgi:hypothetical protein
MSYKPRTENLAALGKLIHAFQSLEFELSGLLGSLLDREDVKVGIIVSSQLSFSRLLDTLDAVFRYRCSDQELLEHFSDLLKRATEYEQERNVFIHSYYDQWDFIGDNAQYRRIKRRTKRGKGYSPTVEDFDPTFLSDLASKVQVTAWEVINFATELKWKEIIHRTWAETDFVVSIGADDDH